MLAALLNLIAFALTLRVSLRLRQRLETARCISAGRINENRSKENMTTQEDLAFALKEWNATVAALETGRQILLLRKGGLLDPEGAFSLEHSRFWLAPNRYHEDESLVKPGDVAFLKASPPTRGVLRMNSFARAEKSWIVPREDAAKLAQLEHIWSTPWLESRFDYQPEKPLLVVALRVFVLAEPHVVEMRAEYSGCKSWLELHESLPTSGAIPALEDAEFLAQVQAAERVLGA